MSGNKDGNTKIPMLKRKRIYSLGSKDVESSGSNRPLLP